MPLREVNCSHCFREVFVNADNKCPACGGNVAEVNRENDGLRPAEFVDGEKLPPFCVVCARPSESYTEVGEKNEPQGHDRVGLIARVVGALAGMIAIPIKPNPTVKEYKISVRVPVCENHRQSKALTPLDIDYETYKITLPVHAEFVKKRTEQRP